MTTPGGNYPDNALSGADLSSLDGLNEADWREGLNDRVIGQPSAGVGFNAFGGFLDAIGNMVQGIFSGGFLGAILDPIASLLGMRWDQVDEHDYAIGDLQDKTQQLEGVIGYGCRYMSSSPGVSTTPTTMPFNTQVGPVLGCELQSGGRTKLLSKGLWRFEAQCRFTTAKWAPPACYMDIVIRDTSGNEFTRLKAMISTDDEVTVTNVMPVVVPAAGYTAEVQAWTSRIPIIGGSWRAIGGGFTTTRFSCFKISEETS